MLSQVASVCVRINFFHNEEKIWIISTKTTVFWYNPNINLTKIIYYSFITMVSYHPSTVVKWK